MPIFEVQGGHSLKGSIVPQGAKNEALQVISAVLMTDKEVTIQNIPNIIDVDLLIELLGDEGERWGRSVEVLVGESEKLVGDVFISAA